MNQNQLQGKIFMLIMEQFKEIIMENISFCSDKDFDKLQKFINEKWKENHILSVDKKLMDFQHKSKNGYNFVISKNNYDEITGILGFIPLSKFDENLKNTTDIWLAIWKVDEEKGEIEIKLQKTTERLSSIIEREKKIKSEIEDLIIFFITSSGLLKFK